MSEIRVKRQEQGREFLSKVGSRPGLSDVEPVVVTRGDRHWPQKGRMIHLTVAERRRQLLFEKEKCCAPDDFQR